MLRNLIRFGSTSGGTERIAKDQAGLLDGSRCRPRLRWDTPNGECKGVMNIAWTLPFRPTALTRFSDPMENTLPITEQSPFFGSIARCEPLPVKDSREGSFPLRLVRECEWVRVVAMNGGPGFHDRLAGMGLHIGAEMQILCNPMDGKLIVCLGGTRLFLGGGIAQKIQVVITKGMSE